jgi:UDP-N-acetylmuramyl tripeptide synthase
MHFAGSKLDMSPTINMKISDLEIKSPYQGFYNAYNVLAAVAFSSIMGISSDVIQSAMASFKPRAGRMETFVINGKKTILILVKNPTGLNQSLSMLSSDTTEKNLFIALNDNAADGRDISWIWDADVESVTEAAAVIKQIVCSGQRSGDIAVRIKHTGFDPQRIIIKTPLQEGIETVVYGESKITYILSTYTALFQCRKILVKMQKKNRVAIETGQQQQKKAEGE